MPFGESPVSGIAGRCSAHSLTTQTLLNPLCWAIGEDRGTGIWVMAARDESKQFVHDRVETGLRRVTALLLARSFTFAAEMNKPVPGRV